MAPMKLMMVALAAATFLEEKATCNPKTKVCLATSKTAAGDINWECKPAVAGAKEIIPEFPEFAPVQAKTCGPATFKFSPMQCAGSNFNYKLDTFVTETKEDDGCKIIQFDHGKACYEVEC